MSAHLDPGPLLPALRRLDRELLSGIEVPLVVPVRRLDPPPVLADPAGAARREVVGLLARAGRPPGPVAVAVGSRGIDGAGGIVGAALAALREAGHDPFVVPAMGSHGAATAAGQAALLEQAGVPAGLIRASMETVVVGEVGGLPLHLDRLAAESGTVLVVNRVKPHTSFRGPLESGLAKMAVIGLGKQAGARVMHSRGAAAIPGLLAEGARVLRARGLLLGGLAVVENRRGEVGRIEAVDAAGIGAAAEERLLELARAWMPSLPVAGLDLLVVDRMGKDVSGTGMDTNVLRRFRVPGLAEPDPAAAGWVVVLGLTEGTEGNAHGMGLADFTTAALAGSVDLVATYTNAITAGQMAGNRMKMPAILADDRAAIRAAISARGHRGPVRLAWISDTLHTDAILVSEAVAAELAGRADLEVGAPARRMPFDAGGRLAPAAGELGDWW